MKARRARLEPAVTQRHLLVGRILGSFVALFLVVFGYIKLEELNGAATTPPCFGWAPARWCFWRCWGCFWRDERASGERGASAP